MSNYTPETIGRIFRLGWGRDTSADPNNWTSARPSYGQCAVTALAVQATFGGDLLRTLNEGVSHYWNRLPDGSEVDHTRDQFDIWEPGEVVVRTREYALSHPATALRYKVLTERIGMIP